MVFGPRLTRTNCNATKPKTYTDMRPGPTPYCRKGSGGGDGLLLGSSRSDESSIWAGKTQSVFYTPLLSDENRSLLTSPVRYICMTSEMTFR